MTRFQRRIDSDTGYQDGQIFSSPGAGFLAVPVVALTRVTLGQFVYNFTNTNGTIRLIAQLGGPIFRTGLQDDLQEQFGSGSATGAQGLASSSNPTPAGVSGSPPFTGISQFTSVTAPRPKGIQINSVALIYTITGVGGLSAVTGSVTRTAFSNNAAAVNTAVLAAAQNGLATAAQGQPYVTVIPIPTPTYLTSPNEVVTFEYIATQPAANSNCNFFGVNWNVTYNLH